MSSVYQILFLLENEEALICEVKRTDLVDAPKDKKYHWVFYDKTDRSVKKLSFVSMNSSDDLQERSFKQGELKFNDSEGLFEGAGKCFILQNHSGISLSKIVLDKVCCYLDQLC